jgi:hypothetical protein
MKRLTNFLLFSLLVFSCKKETSTSTFIQDPAIIQDQYGRQLILHGLNTSSNAKYGNYHPWIIESDVEREDTAFGFNFVRYLTSWVAIEPEKGVYDESYLNELERRVKDISKFGLHKLPRLSCLKSPAITTNTKTIWPEILNNFRSIHALCRKYRWDRGWR